MNAKTGLGVVCSLMLLLSGAVSAAEQRGRIVLSYEPRSGRYAEYDFEITAQVKADSGAGIASIFSNRLNCSLEMGESRDGTPRSALLKAIQTGGEFNITADDSRKIELPERVMLFKSTDGRNVQLNGDAGEVFSANSISLVYDTIGADGRLHRGKQWRVETRIMLQGQTVPVEILYTLADAKKYAGEMCVMVTSSMKVDHTFDEGRVKQAELLVEGESLYAHRLGRFMYSKITASGNGTLSDGTRAEVEDFSLVMSLHGSRPAANTAASGVIFSFVPFPPVWLLAPFAVLLVVFAAMVKFAGDALRQILTAAMVALVILSSVPVAPASAESITSANGAAPAGPVVSEGLHAFHVMLYELIANGAGLSAAGAAGVGMGGTKCASLGAAYTHVPAWNAAVAHKAANDAFAALPYFGGNSEPGAQKSAAAGIFSTTNMLIGGGIAAVGGGAAAAAGNGGGSGSKPAEIQDIPVEEDNEEFFIYVAPMGYPDNPPGVVDVYLDGELVMQNVTLKSPAWTEMIELTKDVFNVEVFYVSGGANQSARIDVILWFSVRDIHMMRTFTVDAQTSATWTVNAR